MSAPAYSPQELEILMGMVRQEIPAETIAKILKRSTVSVRVRISKLRDDRKLVRPQARPGPVAAGRQAASNPGITLGNDAELVRLSRSEGGFPRAVTLEGRTFWIRPDGRQWEHFPREIRKAAA